MQAEINIESPLTLGELREIVNNGQLSKFPDDMQINMCIELCRENVIDETEQPCAPILSIVGDNDKINFYNYI